MCLCLSGAGAATADAARGVVRGVSGVEQFSGGRQLKAFTSRRPTEAVPLVRATLNRVVLIWPKVTWLYWLAAVG